MAKKYYTESVARAQAKYNKEKCTHFSIKLHNENDKDIIDLLNNAENKQALIKESLRRGLEDGKCKGKQEV